MATSGYVDIKNGDGEAGIDIVMGAAPTIQPLRIFNANNQLLYSVGVLGGFGSAAASFGVQLVNTTPVNLQLTSSTIIPVDATGGNIVITLPAINLTGRFLVIQKIDSSANTVTINRAAADTIGVTAATSIVLYTQGATVSLYGNAGTNWLVVPQDFAADSYQLKTVATTPYTVTINDFALEIDATGGASTVNLPAANAVPKGWPVKIKKIDASANAVTVTRAGADTIEGATTAALAAQWNSVTLTSDGVSLWLKF